MKPIEIKSRFKTYRVESVGDFAKLADLAGASETFFVLDRKVYELYRDSLPAFPQDRLFLIDAVETKKTIETALAICERMTAMPAKRNTHLVSLGGGIVQDITGFVATSLYRGIRWTFFPTTLLSACDSCIGGKSSLNYKGFKNLLGSFYPPDEIFIYAPFFRTLTQRDYCSGLGEVVKFQVIAGGDRLAWIESDMEALLAHDYAKLTDYVEESLLFKKRFIEADEFDRGERILLNYAHTFGHAYEVASSYDVPHGSAVALGMITANRISVARGLLGETLAKRVENLALRILTEIKWRPEYFDGRTILSAIHKDKKQTSTALTAVLLRADETLAVYRDIKESEVREALKATCALLEKKL